MSKITDTSTDDLHARFCQILPRVKRHAQILFRGLIDSNQREDAIAETIGLAWLWYARLVRRGKDPNRFISVLASFAVKHVRSGRKVCGQEKAKDVSSRRTQQRHGFRVERFPDKSTLRGSPWEEALHDTKRSTVPDLVSFKIDFRTWLQSLTVRDRSVAKAMMLGHTTQALANRFGVSPARISQLRRELHKSWTQFWHDDEGSLTPLAHA